MVEILSWRLRRVAARLRQQDVARSIGVSITRYSSIERGELQPTTLQRELIEKFLPPLPVLADRPVRGNEGFAQDAKSTGVR